MPRAIWVAYGLLTGILLGAQIFVPPSVGLVNNGDFAKVSGYYDLGPWNGSQDEYKSLVRDYVFSPQFHWASNIVTSEHLFIWPAVRISRAFISRDHFDIRILGLFHLLALMLAFAGAAVVLSALRPLAGVVLGMFTLLVFTDVAYSSSLNSFYTDTATMLFLLLTVVAAIASETPPHQGWFPIICLAAGGILLITSKAQHVVLGFPLCLLAIVSAFQSAKRIRFGWIVICVAWLLTIVFMRQSTDPQNIRQPLFTTIFYKIGKSSTDPAKDFRELGLGPEYLRLKGVFAYETGAPVDDPEWRETFERKTSFGKVCLFYLHHPQRAFGLIWQDIKDYGWLYPDPGLLRNGRRFFSLWHKGRSYMFIHYPVHIVLLVVLSLAFCAACCTSQAIRQRYPAWLCFLAVVIMALLELAIATLADAADTARHLYTFHVLTDIVLCFWMWALADLAARYLPESFWNPRAVVSTSCSSRAVRSI